MIELRKDQIEKAAKAIHRAVYKGEPWTDEPNVTKELCRECATAAAPYLQSPWEPPTEEELRYALGSTLDIPAQQDVLAAALEQFVSRRNTAPLPPPVDPRRERVLKVTENSKITRFEELADAILAALDAEK